MLDQIRQSRASNKLSFPVLYICIGLFFVAQRGFLLWGRGSTTFFAYILFLAGISYSLYYFRHKLVGLRPFLLSGPLLLILAMSFLAIFYGEDGYGSGIMYFIVLLIMFGLYYTASLKGDILLKVIPWLTIVFSVGIFLEASGIWDTSPGTIRSSGICENEDTVGLLLGLCIFLLRGRWLLLTPVALAAIVFTGCYWILPGMFLVTSWLVFRKWGLGYLTFLFALCFLLGGLLLSSSLIDRIWQFEEVEAVIESKDFKASGPWNNRISQYERVIEEVSIFGHGYNPSRTNEIESGGDRERMAHSVLFLITNDLGPIAALAWLVATLYAIVKSRRYRYALIVILFPCLIGCNDFWLFNCLMPFYFVLMGLVAYELTSSSKSEVSTTISG